MRRLRGFSLLELLVVVVVLTTLLIVLLPALQRGRETARRAVCGSQLRQIGVGVATYTQENDDYLPRSTHSAYGYGTVPWGYALIPQLAPGQQAVAGPEFDRLFRTLYRCPSDKRTATWSYGKSVWPELTSAEAGDVVGQASGPTYPRLASIPRPANTILFAELLSSSMADHVMAHFWLIGGAPEVDMRRHGTLSNFLFFDGHVAADVFKRTFDPTVGIDNWNPGTAQ